MNKDILLTKEKKAADVLKNLFLDAICKAQSHLEAVFADKQSESLHQYRVNIRKMRSILCEFKKCMDEDIYLLLKAELKNLVTHTNDLRDLDVFLENIKRYRTLVPKKLQKNLEKIENEIFQKRNDLFEDVKKGFKTTEYQKSLYITNDLVKEQKFYSEYAKNDIYSVSKNVIKKRLKDIKKRSKEITKESESAEFHKMRLSIKKLRYSVESFAEFYERQKTEAFLKKLKSLQDLFGGIQDKEIEKMRIKEYFHDDPDFSGFLISLLENESKKEKKSSCKKLKNFFLQRESRHQKIF